MKKKYFYFLLFIISVVLLFSCRYTRILEESNESMIIDEKYLTVVQKATFKYFYDSGHSHSGLAYDRYPVWPNGCVSGGTGMGLMAIIVGVERCFVSREDAAERVLKILNFLKNTCPRYYGAWAHFINGQTGETIVIIENDDGADLIETAFLIQGVLTVHQYFNKINDVENNIRNLAQQIWHEVEWDWFLRENAETDINLFGGNNTLWGSGGTKSYDASNGRGGTGLALKIYYDMSSDGYIAPSLTPGENYDVSNYAFFSFWVKKDSSTSSTYFTIGLKDENEVEVNVSVEDYIDGGVVTNDYKEVNIPLSAFSGVDLTSLAYIYFSFKKSDLNDHGCPIPGTVYFDDMKFIDSEGPSEHILDDFEACSLSWHWSQENGWIINAYIEGFNEGMIAYLLAIASPTHSISVNSYKIGWARGGGKNYVNSNDSNKWNGIQQYLVPAGSWEAKEGMPLFWTHYSYLGFDPRGKKDGIINKDYDVDYFQVFRNISLIDRAYCQNAGGYGLYNSHIWGLTASDEPWDFGNNGYGEHSPHKDNGTMTPTAAISAIAYFIDYTPNYSIDAMNHFYEDYGDKLWGKYGFEDFFHLGKNWWHCDAYLAIDQGPIIVMIENYRTQLLWKYFMSHPDIQNLLNILEANGWTIEDIEY